MKLVFATLIRAADRWCRVSISDLERHQLTLPRVELGLDQPQPIPMTTKPTDATAPPHDQQATDLQGAQDLTPSAWIGLGARFTGPRDLTGRYRLERAARPAPCPAL
jgi:hypothetical protein